MMPTQKTSRTRAKRTPTGAKRNDVHKPVPKGHKNGPMPTPHDDDIIDLECIPVVGRPASEGAPRFAPTPVGMSMLGAARARIEIQKVMGVKTPIDIPSNMHLVNRAKRYPKELARVLGKQQAAVRDFVLSEIVPTLQSLDYGPEDAADVIRSSLDVDPDMDELRALLRALKSQALYLKVESFVIRHFNFTEEEAALFRIASLTRNNQGTPNGFNLETVMRQMQELSKLSRSAASNDKTLLRELRTLKGDRARPDRSGGRGLHDAPRGGRREPPGAKSADG